MFPWKRFHLRSNCNFQASSQFPNRSPSRLPLVFPMRAALTRRPPPISPQIGNNTDAMRKTWNPKFTLRSHFDGIRALAFHPVEPVLVTASEDHTLKMWNLQKTAPAKK